MFCQKSTFLAAIRAVKEAYSEVSIAGRGIDGMRAGIVRNIGPFFDWMEQWAERQEAEINFGATFDELVKNGALASHAGHISKHIALIQLAKTDSPAQCEIRNSIFSNLSKSGHSAAWEAIGTPEQERSIREVTTATVLYHLLALHASLNAGDKGNPIATLRRSMRDRLPEEYFASLVAGWIAEDQFEIAMRGAGASIRLVAGDRDRRIKLKSERRGRSVSINAEADFIVNDRPIDLQRVNSISEPKGSGCVKLGIKHHKLASGMAVVVWFSDKLPPKFGDLKGGYCLITEHEVHKRIRGVREDDAVVYADLQYVRKATTRVLGDLIKRIRKLPMDGCRVREDELPFGEYGHERR